MNQNSRLVKQAQERVEKSILVFTTCAGESKSQDDDGDDEFLVLLRRCWSGDIEKGGL